MQFSKKILLSGLSLGAAVHSFAVDENISVKPESGKPNIIFFLADDAGKFDFGCYGQKMIKTPNVDKLASDGMLFTRHYAGAPVSAPSRCSLLTGKHTGHGFIRDNYEIEPEGQLSLPDSEITIASRLKGVGYSTAAFGKWGLGAPNSEGHPNRKGFDYWYGYLCQRQAHSYYPSHLWENEKQIVLDNEFNIAHQRLESQLDPNDSLSYSKYIGKDFSGELIIQKAEDYLRKVDSPFFLYYATPLPHLGLQIPVEEVNFYRGAFVETPYLGNKGYLPQQYPRSAYAAMIKRVDDDLGRLIAILKEKGIYENTLIVFTSDNGATFDIGGADTDFFMSNGDNRDYKGSVYEGGLAVPFIASWPGVIAAGSESSHLSAHWDFFATACEIAGVENLTGIDSISYLPELRGDSKNQQQHDYLYWEHNRRMQAVVLGDYKAVKIGRFGRLQIYDLKNDPQEKKNIALRPGMGNIRKRVRDIFKNGRIESEYFPLYR
ncbi:MAG: arylsulfatase [Spirochaetales bacterium]|nr:arylsulfatase [Spirochaetales bacterium]